MADEIRLQVEKRNEFGKGAARRIRRADKVPAVVYGRGIEPMHLTLPGHATAMALRADNALLTLDIEGESGTQLALPKQIQRDPIVGTIEHVDLIVVKKGERVVVDIAVYTEGESAPETFVTVEAQTIAVEAEATAIPESVEVSVEGLEAGAQILAQDLTLPAGALYQGDPEDLIVHISREMSQEEAEAELEAAEEEAGIEREPSDEEKQEESESEGSEDE